jgi:hypothetical protein
MGSITRSWTFILITVISTVGLIESIPLGLAQTGTIVNGIISSDATWTKANSPYNVTGAVIAKGVTITIEPGTIVYVNAFEGLGVNGTLRAIGTSNEPITLNGDFRMRAPVFGSSSYNGILSFSDESQTWEDKTGIGCIIENANIVSLSIYLHNATIKLNNNVFSGLYEYHRLWIDGGNSIITNNRIVADTVGAGDNFLSSGNNTVIASNGVSYTPNPTTTTLPTPTSSVPELSWLLTLPLLLSIFSVAAAFRHRNQVKKV